MKLKKLKNMLPTQGEILSIAFYNLENLFDTIDDPFTNDDEYTPTGKKYWSEKKYRKKLRKLGSVIANIGVDKSGIPPVLVGVVEVENLKVLEDLIKSKYLNDFPYGIVHFNSPDERGIDVGLLYHKNYFTEVYAETQSLSFQKENGGLDYTRDILYVTGKLNSEQIHVFVNHWPSRNGDDNEPKRIMAANRVADLISEITNENAGAKIVVMGDFNDDPTNKSIKDHLMSVALFNPMEPMLESGKGSLYHKSQIHVFDQIILSRSFLGGTVHGLRFESAHIFDKDYIKIWKGKYRGRPFRTYTGKKYRGGYSDHFPVYVHVRT